jgi:hypothetical protein
MKVINCFAQRHKRFAREFYKRANYLEKYRRHLSEMHTMIFAALAARLALASGAIVGGREWRRLRAKRASPQHV